MNNRIDELAKLATTVMFDGTGTDVGKQVFDRVKFAELIVQECMRMCEVTEMSFVTHDCDVEASGAITVKQFIAEHFGIEESPTNGETK